MLTKKKFVVVALVVTTVVLWSSAFVAIGYLVGNVAPLTVAFGRFFIASLIFIPLVFLHSRGKSNNTFKFTTYQVLIILISCGVFGIFSYNVLLNYGQIYVDPATASLIVSTVPIITFVLSCIIGIEAITKNKAAAFVLCMIGVYFILFLNNKTSSNWSEAVVLIFGAAICHAIYFILVRKISKNMSAIYISAIPIWIGTILLAIASWKDIFAHQLSTDELLVIGYLGIGPSAVAYLAWSFVLKEIPASIASMYLFLVPVVSLVISWIWLSILPPLAAYIGGFLILLGLMIFNFESIKKLLKSKNYTQL